MEYAYIIGVTTSGLRKGLTVSPTLGCFADAEQAHDHLELLKQDRKFHGGTIVLDSPGKWLHTGDEIRRVVVNRIQHGGYREILIIQKHKIQG
jgi:hypothetical protein